MEYLRLGDCFTIIKGKKVDQIDKQIDNCIRYIQIDDLRNDDNTKYCFPEDKYVLAKKDDVIIAWDGANAGTVSYGLEGAIGSTLAILKWKIEKKVSIPYIGRILQSKSKYLRDMCTGATIPHISRKSLEDIKIPLPDLKIQQKIVQVLDKAQSLIDKRKEQIEQCNNLIESLFYDMFGDPVINSNNYDISPLEVACKKITDGTHDTPGKVDDGILFITGKNIKPFRIDLSLIEYVDFDTHNIIYSRCNPEKGDVLYTNIGVNFGTAALNPFDFEFSMKNVALLKPNNDLINSKYLECILNFMRNYLLDQISVGGAQTFMGLSTINKIKIPVPPIELQNEFADKVQKIEYQKQLLQQSLTLLEDNFNSLMQRAFKGELL